MQIYNKNKDHWLIHRKGVEFLQSYGNSVAERVNRLVLLTGSYYLDK